MSFRIWVPAACALLLAAGPSAARQLTDQSRVRVTIAGELAKGGVIPGKRHQIVGRFVGMDSEHVILAKGSPPRNVPVPKSAITRFEVSRGRSRLKGALIGAGAGAVAGAVWGLVAHAQCQSEPSTGGFSLDLCGLEFVVPMAIAPPAGAVAGLLIGKERWARVPSSALAIGVAPAGRGVQIAGTFRF